MRRAKTVGGATTDYLVDLAATLPAVISDTDAVYLYGLDIIAEQLAGAERYYYVHDGLGSVRQLVDGAGQTATRYAYDPFGVPLEGDKAVHFLTHAFMTYEQRWMGADPYPVWRWNDCQGRALEEITEVLNRFGYKETYSLDDVIANRWGAAFGLGAFDEPGLLIEHCTGRGSRIGTPYGSLGDRRR